LNQYPRCSIGYPSKGTEKGLPRALEETFQPSSRRAQGKNCSNGQH